MGIALVLAGPLACEPAAPPVAPVVPTTPVATGVAVVQPPAYDLAPVAEPVDVIGVLRWKSPTVDLNNLGSCSNVPVGILDQVPRIGLTKAFEKGFRDQVDSSELAGLVALDAPVDAVVTLDSAARSPKPIFAVAVGLTSLDGAKHAAGAKGTLAEIVPGIWRIGDKERRGLACAISVSAGATPARLVCAEKEKDITTLAPYLTRTVPTQAPLASDFHLEVRVTPLDTRFGDQLRQQLRGLPILAQSQATIGEPDFDNAVMTSATALSDELGAFVGDLDRLQIDATLDKGTCLTSTTALQMRGKSSWIVNTLVDHADRVGPPPAIFWRAPRDSSSVFYGRGADPARYTEILRTLRTMLVGAMKKVGVGSDDDRKALAELVAMPLSKDVNTVSSSGHSDPVPAKAGAKPAAATKPAPAHHGSSGAIVTAVQNLGWYVTGFDDSADAIAKQLKDFVAVYNRKGLHDPLKKALGDDATFLPTIKLVTAPAGLGKGALDIEIKLDVPDDEPWKPPPGVLLDDQAPRGGKGGKPAKPVKVAAKPKTKTTLTLHLLLAIDGKAAWIGMGGDRDDVVKHMLMSKSGSPDSETIASRPGLEPLKNGKNLSGGFLTLNTFLKAVENGMGAALADKPSELAEAQHMMSQLPNKGETPIFITTITTAGGTPRTEVKLEMTKGSFEDVGSIVNQAMGAFMRAKP
jgi:hypothetical protein